jgi:hypothetical protein
VTSVADAGPGSLRQAIAIANSGDTIKFDESLSGQTITLSTGELAITQNLNIQGLGSNELAISGNASSRVFDIGSGATVTIAKLRITQGLDQTLGQGGGIDNAGALTVADCALDNNEALGTAANGNGVGGSIFNEAGATLTVVNSTFIDNQVFGGPTGIGWGGAVMNFGTATFTSSTFTGNQASGGGGGFGAGGAIFSLFNPLSVSKCTFTNNEAIDGLGFLSTGGAIGNVFFSFLTVTDSTFTGNQCLELHPFSGFTDGGAIASFVASFSISNCSFADNISSSKGRRRRSLWRPRVDYQQHVHGQCGHRHDARRNWVRGCPQKYRLKPNRHELDVYRQPGPGLWRRSGPRRSRRLGGSHH